VSEINYDLALVAPPLRAPETIRCSSLAAKVGPAAGGGLVEVDPETLQHRDHGNVFALGDIASLPALRGIGAVRSQVPAVVEGVVALIEGRSSALRYDGYGLAAIVSGVGRAVILESRSGQIINALPGVLKPLEESWIGWALRRGVVEGAYRCMLTGDGLEGPLWQGTTGEPEPYAPARASVPVGESETHVI
jgi:sulfide:quinone oxidoreductase